MPDQASKTQDVSLEALDIPLERDPFLRTLLRHLSEVLQDVVGIEEASGFISIVGQKVGDEINAAYCKAFAVKSLDTEQVAQVCIDLKRRIQGDFYLIAQDDEKIVFGNRVCPFAEKVIGRPSLCMMTSNVFGVIAAENLGYGRVVIDKAIARGDKGCQVSIYLRQNLSDTTQEGREYYKADQGHDEP
ncbi:MAG: methanogen output domain 1-containing protein [Oligoflexus sp.]